MIVKVRCSGCYGPLDLSEEFDEAEWTIVRLDKVEDAFGLYCAKCRKEREE